MLNPLIYDFTLFQALIAYIVKIEMYLGEQI